MVETRHILRYWHLSAIDGERLAVSLKGLREGADFFRLTTAEALSGEVGERLARQIFSTRKDSTTVTTEKRPIPSGNQENETINVIVSPVKLSFVPIHGVKRPDLPHELYPLWLPAQINKEGKLIPRDNSAPWIPRNLLDPSKASPEILLGSVDDLNKFMTYNSPPSSWDSWKRLWDYSQLLFRNVNGCQLFDLQLPGYESFKSAILVLDPDVKGAVRHIVSLYNHLLNEKDLPPLVKRIASPDPLPARPSLSAEEHILASGRHLGQMNAMSLAPSQREALHHTIVAGPGDVVAVQGPPGTGKTTCIQSVIATMVVNAAIEGKEPPIIVATSANNQAVTNVIKSMGKIESEESTLSGRWLPDITSYGLYCASDDAKGKENAEEFQTIYVKEGFMKSRETGEFMQKATEFFLQKCRSHAGVPLNNDVGEAAEFLLERIKSVAAEIECGPRRWLSLAQAKKVVFESYGSEENLKQRIQDLSEKEKESKREIISLEAIRSSWLDHIDQEPVLMTLLSFIPRVRKRRVSRNSNFIIKHGYSDAVVDSLAGEETKITNFFKQNISDEKSNFEKISANLRAAENASSNLAISTSDFASWQTAAGISSTPYEMFADMDKELRYKAFKLAVHYWEASWLLELQGDIQSGYEEKRSVEKQLRKWHRYAKITPCFVSTLYMIPKFFTAWEGEDRPLYNGIDLLIVDEAGQVPPEIAGAIFSLAKKALVVGDSLQIEPVWRIPEAVDRGNLKMVAPSADVDEILGEGCIAASNGSVMKLAQRACSYTKGNDRGLFLSEHWRCMPEIIDYCNTLAYSGKLKPERKAESGSILPYMAWAHVKGISQMRGSSRINQIEAATIAKWIAENRMSLEQHYHKRIQEIVGVVTPFKPQTDELRKELTKQGLNGLTAGTTHALQGAERPVIIFSPVYTAKDKTTKFIDKGVNLLNVAVSRAQDSFIVMGDTSIFDPGRPEAPTGLLARYLFSDEKNQLPGVVSAHIESSYKNIERISTPEGHSRLLQDAFSSATSRVVVVSPYLSALAIETDDIHAAIGAAVERGVSVIIYSDFTLNLDAYGKLKENFLKGKLLLEGGGAKVIVAKGIHNKTLCIDDKVICEGSYNWLSAVRIQGHRLQREERTIRLEGEEAGKMIRDAIEEMEAKEKHFQ